MKFFEHLQTIATEAWPAEIMVFVIFKMAHTLHRKRREREKLKAKIERQLSQSAAGEAFEIHKVRTWVRKLRRAQEETK